MMISILKVTWIEHMEVDDRSVHNMYKPLVHSGLAFGAKRWVATLERQCERLASSMASNIPGDLSGKGYLDNFDYIGAESNEKSCFSFTEFGPYNLW